MSIEHKAFVFDIDAFNSELRMLLESALNSGNIDKIREFIISNKEFLSDPCDGGKLDDDWEIMIEDKDAHQYGDFALTKYYSPLEDMGLGSEWQRIESMFFSNSDTTASPFLGVPVGSSCEFFDPGKMGSYFQSVKEVRESLDKLVGLESVLPDDLVDAFEQFKGVLERALKQNKGVYVTF